MFTSNIIRPVDTESLNAYVRLWDEALAARRATKAAFDATYNSFSRHYGATLEQVGQAYDADRAAYIALGQAHANATAAYNSYNR